MAKKEEMMFNEVLKLLRMTTQLNVELDNASEVELYRIRELQDPSSGNEYVGFFAVALQGQVEKLAKKLDREW